MVPQMNTSIIKLLHDDRRNAGDSVPFVGRAVETVRSRTRPFGEETTCIPRVATIETAPLGAFRPEIPRLGLSLPVTPKRPPRVIPIGGLVPSGVRDASRARHWHADSSETLAVPRPAARTTSAGGSRVRDGTHGRFAVKCWFCGERTHHLVDFYPVVDSHRERFPARRPFSVGFGPSKSTAHRSSFAGPRWKW